MNIAGMNINFTALNLEQQSLVKRYTLSPPESFRIYLGLSDECTFIKFCQDKSNLANATQYLDAMCHEPTAITFNLLNNKVNGGGLIDRLLVSTTADFILSEDGKMLKLEVMKGLTSSDAMNDEAEFVTLTDVDAWKEVTLLASGYECISALERLKRETTMNRVQLDNTRDYKTIRAATDLTKKKASLQFINAFEEKKVDKVNSDNTTDCRKSSMCEIGIAGLGSFISLGKQQMATFLYTL